VGSQAAWEGDATKRTAVSVKRSERGFSIWFRWGDWLG
jgi:hypothetical protein